MASSSSKRKGGFDKKNALHFTFMHRSQQDPLYHTEDGSKMVLHPANERTAKALEGVHEMGSNVEVIKKHVPFAQQIAKDSKQPAVREIREMDEYGLPLDGYDYSQHLSTVQDSTFIGPGGVTIKAFPDAASKKRDDDDIDRLLIDEIPLSVLASATEESRMLEAITLNPDNMDPEMRRQLKLDEDDEEEEEDDGGLIEEGDLDDDFMTQLLAANAQAPAEDEFDFDQHVARLMEAAGDDEEDLDDDEEGVDGDDDEQQQHHNRPIREIDQRFEAVLEREYEDEDDDDDDGDLAARGTLSQTDPLLMEAMDEFLRDKGTQSTNKGVPRPDAATIAALGGGKDDDDVEENALMEDEDDDEDGDVTSAVLQAWGTYRDTRNDKPRHDAQSIVSTYSTTDNLPTTIQPMESRSQQRRRRREKQQQQDDNEEEVKSLSMDIARLTMVAVAERLRDETPEERKARKKNVREAKKVRRIEKKTNKETYTAERAKYVKTLTAPNAPKPGVTEYKLS